MQAAVTVTPAQIPELLLGLATVRPGRVRVRGRGGTVLQPGIDLLQRAGDFPPAAPVLVITDGWCDPLRIRREHAFLIPQGGSLPFTPRGPVFRLT
ncbi:putative metal-dependent peptidase [Streptomyces sp. V1I1]|nr:putative metal-dependent peptidase [Streptomyces sp. V1I1]